MYENRLRDVMGLAAPWCPPASKVLVETAPVPCGCPATWTLREAYFENPTLPRHFILLPGWKLTTAHVCVTN